MKLPILGSSVDKLSGRIADLISIFLLLGVFVAVVLWFDFVDFYHRHFFSRGVIVIADNAARTAFVLLLSWLIYAPGAGIAAMVLPMERRARVSPAEWAVLGFGIGVGLWHLGMLILGVVDLYYRGIMVALALMILLASASHFAEVARAGRRALTSRIALLRRGVGVAETICIGLISVGLAWLLMVRGLYPGGGTDYYAHYFYYYLEVLKHHGLAPNDVWYHYYYSKGYGLFFFGMLLTDPEAPALVTFCCVAFAAVAMATLAARMAPRSLWPVCGAMLFLLFYIGGFGHYGGGEFQKDHEQVSALIVLFTWAICMEACAPVRPWRMMSAATAVAASIVCQPAGILLASFTGLLSGWALLRRRWNDFIGYGLVTGAIAAAVLGMFALSYFVTGLATDHELEFSLRFANFARLDSWGVIPQLIAILWVLDNLRAMAPPFGWDSFYQVAIFMRLDVLWPFLTGPFIALAVLATVRWVSPPSKVISEDVTAASIALASSANVGALVTMLAAISVLSGQVRSISFERFSTFFVPLLILLTVSGSAWALNQTIGKRPAKALRIVLPFSLLVGVLTYWQATHHWGGSAYRTTKDAISFAAGLYSLAEAYTHTPGFPFGAINPGALAAAQQLPPNTPIWTTNLESFCMAPGCLIESVVSFKMSGRLDDILGGKPELAKQLLQQAGINYFLFSKDSPLLDLLPYSRLFAPETIAHHLGIKWSDGSMFLLTWKGPETKPIGPEFIDDYKKRLAEPEEQWFNFSKLAQQIIQLSPQFRSPNASAVLHALPWRYAPAGTIDIMTATYGQNCRYFRPSPPAVNTFRPNNATRAVRDVCRGIKHCRITIDVARLGDPVPQCGKDFSVIYRCSPDGPSKTIEVSGEANGKTVDLECSQP
jgi:hypothetical protein